METNMILGKFLCFIVRAFGGAHRWRRLRKREQPKNYLVAELSMGRSIRVCDRCEVQRWAKARRKKAS